MEWEKKIKLVQLGNERNESEEGKKEFQKYVLENMHEFDGQAWDMFCNLVDIIPKEMVDDSEFWLQVYDKFKDVDCNDPKLGLRSGMRIALIQTICEEELICKIPTPKEEELGKIHKHLENKYKNKEDEQE